MDAINMRDGIHRTQLLQRDQMTFADFRRNWHCWLDVLQAQQAALLDGTALEGLEWLHRQSLSSFIEDLRTDITCLRWDMEDNGLLQRGR